MILERFAVVYVAVCYGEKIVDERHATIDYIRRHADARTASDMARAARRRIERATDDTCRRATARYAYNALIERYATPRLPPPPLKNAAAATRHAL